ncbi:uncharacterized protein LOC129598808 [Paramacrobiotus metropolitanus]|uniref:uncharacterized protein LOC129598808 n=1 Tax=Paramacrobiotus metropolitanus TaxID=2943436 RepID=UPI002446450B|nr:uncharacterized protein LOC129598808 [Paramacrobiotus metropolitanus]
MRAYYLTLAYHAVPMYDMLNGMAPIGVAVYPLVSPCLMTPVCWDVNVVMSFRGRRLFIHAVEEIPNYTGLKDLQYNDIQDPFCSTRTERRGSFETLHGYPCTCRKCTPKYEADINPLQCATVGCTNRIPSDDRALQPCVECGASNKEKLTEFRCFLAQYEDIRMRGPKDSQLAMMTDLCTEMEAADILQPDAHLRYLCGLALPRKLYWENRFEEGWKMMQEMTDCARNIYPKYEVYRAIVLSRAGYNSATALKKRVVEQIGQLSAAEKKQLKTISDQAFCVIFEYCREMVDIFTLLYGERSKEAVLGDNMITRMNDFVRDIEKAFRDNE